MLVVCVSLFDGYVSTVTLWGANRSFYNGVDLAMNTTTSNMLAVPVINRSLGENEGKVIAVSQIQR